MDTIYFCPNACIKSRATHLIHVLSILFALILMSGITTHAAQGSKKSWSIAPAFSGGVGLFFPVTPLSEDNLKYWFTPQIQQAKTSGLQFVNLIVHWRDLEPEDNHFSFDLLGRYIQTIKSSGLQCVLRIYFNGGWHIQASPDWLFSEKQGAWCLEGDYVQPLPWNDVYIQEVTVFMEALADWLMVDSINKPHALQISAGGVYGEMAVMGFDWQTAFDGDYDQFYNLLMEAEMTHVDIFASFSEKLGSIPLILMINHLYDNYPEMNDQLLDYAWNTYGLRWFQSNAWSGALEEEAFGPLILDMMKRHASGGVFALEDEYGFYQETLDQRIQRIIRIESETEFQFQSVTLNPGDLTAFNQADIDYLISLVQKPKSQIRFIRR